MKKIGKKQLFVYLIVIGSAIFLSSCINQGNAGIKNGEIRIYYFYNPACPNCKVVEPYIHYLINNTNVTFELCNVKNFENCSNTSKSIAKSIYKEKGYFGVPTAVAYENGNYTIFIGWKNVLKLTEFLEKRGYEIRKVEINKTAYNLKECIECHKKRNLLPPSTFNCTYCCHGI